MSTWKTLCRVDDIPTPGRTQGQAARTAATSPCSARPTTRSSPCSTSCPHKGGPLSEGIVFGDSVACPLHNWTIALNDGCAVAPDVGRVQRFTVKLEGGTVSLDMDELVPAVAAE